MIIFRSANNYACRNAIWIFNLRKMLVKSMQHRIRNGHRSWKRNKIDPQRCPNKPKLLQIEPWSFQNSNPLYDNLHTCRFYEGKPHKCAGKPLRETLQLRKPLTSHLWVLPKYDSHVCRKFAEGGRTRLDSRAMLSGSIFGSEIAYEKYHPKNHQQIDSERTWKWSQKGSKLKAKPIPNVIKNQCQHR